jgi:hypothetical protein
MLRLYWAQIKSLEHEVSWFRRLSQEQSAFFGLCGWFNANIGLIDTRLDRQTSRTARRNMQALELATLGWVDWFNNRRLLGPIGNIPPPEAVENCYAQCDVLEMVAQSEAMGLR